MSSSFSTWVYKSETQCEKYINSGHQYMYTFTSLDLEVNVRIFLIFGTGNLHWCLFVPMKFGAFWKLFEFEIYTSTSLKPVVDELATSCLVIVTFTSFHLYLRNCKCFEKLFPQRNEFWILFCSLEHFGNFVKWANLA